MPRPYALQPEQHFTFHLPARRSRWRAATLALVLVTALVFLAVTDVMATHPQSAGGKTVTFDHHAGSEWWVEVRLGGADAASVTGVEAMDTGGPWVPLTHQSWGTWGKSFHIEPGHTVKFRGTWSGGTQIESCTFTHPAGVEQCGAPAGLAFDHRGGNEWWVQVKVTGGTPSQVQAMDTAGPWVALTLRSWGDWAQSFHIEPGHDVKFRAMVGGVWQESCWFTHPAGVEQCEGAGFQATFSDAHGHSWWVSVRVTGNEPIAGVDARYDCGRWVSLRLRDWGAWAESFHVPDGSKVDFRAHSFDGDRDVSGGYLWPGATPTSACPVVPPQTPAWDTVVMHDGEPVSGINDMAIGVTAWHDEPSLYSATQRGVFWTHHTNGEWVTELVNDRSATSIAIGDAERDGDNEVYVGSTDGKVYVLVDSGPGGLSAVEIATVDDPDAWVQTLTIGDVDRDGKTELYAMSEEGDVFKIWRPSMDEWYQQETISSIGAMAISSWIADGDRDGKVELYIGSISGGAYQVDWTGTSWQTTRIMKLCCGPGVKIAGIVAGDANGDGKTEVYTTVGDGILRKVTWTGSTWVRETIATFDTGLGDLAIANLDGDGRPELYFTTMGSHHGDESEVWRVHWNGNAWQKTLLMRSETPYPIDSVVVGDADANGSREVYAGGSDGRIYQVRP